LINSAFTGHPSALEIPKDIESVKLPLAIAIGTKDMMLYGKGLETTKEILEKKSAYTEVQVYQGAGHGFCVRADLTTEDAIRQAKEAEEQAVAFFKRTFASK
jgi:dienelactone hydrolase